MINNPKRTGIILILIGTIGVIGSILLFFQSTPTDNTKQENQITQQSTNNKAINKNQQTTGENNLSNNNTITIITGDQLIVNILIPGFLFNDDFLKLAKQVKQKYNIIVNFQTIENMYEYKQLIKQQLSGYTDTDLFMISTSRLNSFKGYNKSINIQEQFGLSNYVHPLFFKLINQPYNFIPHIIDPAITLINKTANFSPKSVTWSNLFDYLNIKKKVNHKIAILRGFDNNDIKLLKRGRESFFSYFDILYQSIFQLTSGNNIKETKSFINLSTSTLPQSRQYIKFKQNYTLINKRVKNCDLFPGVCLLAYQYGDIKIGYLTDTSIWYKYFPKTKFKPTDITITNIPTYAHTYPVRGRGFVIHPQTQKDYAIQKFIQEYIKSATTQSLDLRKNNLSAYMAVYNIQKQKDIYSKLMDFEKYFDINLSALDTQSNFIKNTNIINFMSKEIGAPTFLNQFKRNR